jgi:hypothetical protein
LPNHATTPLASGAITNHDEITVILIEPTDGTPALVSVQWPGGSPRQPPPTTKPQQPIVRIIAESATELAAIKARRRL